MRKPKVYFAGKTRRRAEFAALQTTYNIDIVSRWCLTRPCEPTPHNSERFWDIDFQDIRQAEFLICQADQNLYGALVECGYALALGVTVILVGECPAFNTWQFHKPIIRVPTMSEALARVVWSPQ